MAARGSPSTSGCIPAGRPRRAIQAHPRRRCAPGCRRYRCRDPGRQGQRGTGLFGPVGAGGCGTAAAGCSPSGPGPAAHAGYTLAGAGAKWPFFRAARTELRPTPPRLIPRVLRHSPLPSLSGSTRFTRDLCRVSLPRWPHPRSSGSFLWRPATPAAHPAPPQGPPGRVRKRAVPSPGRPAPARPWASACRPSFRLNLSAFDNKTCTRCRGSAHASSASSPSPMPRRASTMTKRPLSAARSRSASMQAGPRTALALGRARITVSRQVDDPLRAARARRS